MLRARRVLVKDFGIPFWNGKGLNLVELKQLEFGLASHWRASLTLNAGASGLSVLLSESIE